MNTKDKQDLELVHYRLDEMDKKIDELKYTMRDDHKKVAESLSFIKENLFNPNEGLWAETKQNTLFRDNTTKWRSVIGVGFIGLMIDKVWNMFN
jgi:two-component SAPR family response regulator